MMSDNRSCSFTVDDIDRCSPSVFQPSDHVSILGMAPVACLVNGVVNVDRGFTVVGMCDRIGSSMDRDHCFGLMLWSHESGRLIWQHYPESGKQLPWRGNLPWWRDA